jgi:hypothetical protein
VVGAVSHRPGHRAATAPVIQRADPEQAGHGGDVDGGGGHLRRPMRGHDQRRADNQPRLERQPMRQQMRPPRNLGLR